MQTYDFAVTQQGQINANGNAVFYVSGAAGGADDGIVITAERGGSRVELQPGQGYVYTDVSTTFRIAPRTPGVPVVGRLLIGQGDFRNNRISGQVEVIDGGRGRTLSDRAFISSVTENAGAGLWPHAQLFNNTTDKRFVVRQLDIGATGMASIGAIYIRLGGTAIGTFSYSGLSKRIKTGGIFVASGDIRQGSFASPGIGGNNQYVTYLPQNTSRVITLQEPIILDPQTGITALISVNQCVMTCTIEYSIEDLNQL